MLKPGYRLDIAGLRAIAILGVLIFHISAFHLPGGFVGVDIFYVISGYLITDHIWRDLQAGKFSIAGFYLKRIRRLYPALFVMLAVVSVTVYTTYLPVDTAQYGSSLLASTLYVSNFFFYSQSDYFNSDLATSPLLHTWSLSVEEQFYLLFPLLMLMVFKRPKGKILWILIGGALVSAIASQWALSWDASAAFFISPFRFWQLLAGSAIVFMPKPTFANILIPEGMAAVGLTAIAFCMLAFSDRTPFPGANALVPTLGAALAIYAGQQPGLATSRLISIAPARFFGQISYSLYLWHWPVLAIYRYRVSSSLNPVEKLALLLACIALGYLSFRFIEKTTRSLSISAEKPWLKWVATLATLAGVGAGVALMGGAPDRYSAEIQRLSAFAARNQRLHARPHDCYLSFQNQGVDEFDFDACLALKAGAKTVLLMGDSHAFHLAQALSQTNPKTHFALAIASGCRPVLAGKGTKMCRDFRERVFNDYIPSRRYDTIILSGRWSAEEAKGIAETVKHLSPHAGAIIVSGPVIEYALPLPRLLAFSAMKGDSGESITEFRLSERIQTIDSVMRTALVGTPAKYFSVYDTMCPKGSCTTVTSDKMPVQWDYGHLTLDGALAVVAAMGRASLF